MSGTIQIVGQALLLLVIIFIAVFYTMKKIVGKSNAFSAFIALLAVIAYVILVIIF